jgi:hypothetical protein
MNDDSDNRPLTPAEAARKALDARLESDPRFLRRVERARKSLRAGRGIWLESIKP